MQESQYLRLPALALGPGHPRVWELSVPGRALGPCQQICLQETEEEVV